MAEVDPKLKGLYEWINDTHDGHISSADTFLSPKLGVKRYEGVGRGFEAKEMVSKKELLIKISHSHLLNYVSVLRHIGQFNKSIRVQDLPFPGIFVPKTVSDDYTSIYTRFSHDELMGLSSFQLLMMYLVLEKNRGSNSFWKEFIDVLPVIDDFAMATFTWELLKVPEHDKLVEYLPPKTALHTQKVRERFLKDHGIVTRLLAEKLHIEESEVDSRFPMDTFLWAWMCVNSRCLYMDIKMNKAESDNLTMAPIVDFINHSTEDECQLRIDIKGFHVFSGDKSYPAGEQVFLSYGPHSNDFLLCEYGFVVPNNKWNDLDITNYILAFAKDIHIQFLKGNDYYGDYTIDSTSVPSFRTEIALAVIQEFDPYDSRRLQAFMNGVSDGTVYRSRSHLILTQILLKVIGDFNATFLEYSSDEQEVSRARKKAIGLLHRNLKDIAEKALADVNTD